MAEYIERRALQTALIKRCEPLGYEYKYVMGWYDCLTRVRDIVSQAPAADVAPIVQGYWIKGEATYPNCDYYCVYHNYECGNCGATVNYKHRLPKYCPECGSRNEVKR